jgi:hypothetical protein
MGTVRRKKVRLLRAAIFFPVSIPNAGDTYLDLDDDGMFF